jgi:tetratricopeptide (TPR) repeat protein
VQKFRLISFIIFSVLISTSAPASEKSLNTKESIPFESKILDEIKKNKINDKKLFYHYLLAARSLKKNGNHTLAIEYYEKALELSVEQNKRRLQAYLEFGHYLLSRSELSKLKKITKTTRLFIKKQNDMPIPSESLSHVEHTLNYFDILSSQRLTQEAIGRDYTYFKNTHYWESIQNYEFEKRMEFGEFESALKMINLDGKKLNKNSDVFYDRIVAYDLLRIIGQKKIIKSLKCKIQLPKNDKLAHYSYDICRILINGTKFGKINARKVDNLITLLQKLNGRQYLIPALNQIKSL